MYSNEVLYWCSTLLSLRYRWEWFCSIEFDWDFVTGKKRFRWPMVCCVESSFFSRHWCSLLLLQIFYFAGRYLLLFALIGMYVDPSCHQYSCAKVTFHLFSAIALDTTSYAAFLLISCILIYALLTVLDTERLTAQLCTLSTRWVSAAHGLSLFPSSIHPSWSFHARCPSYLPSISLDHLERKASLDMSLSSHRRALRSAWSCYFSSRFRS